MYTLRRIEQKGFGIEKKTNNFLGNEYTVIHRVPSPTEKDEFRELCESYFNTDVSRKDMSDEREEVQEIRNEYENIAGFVVNEGGKMFPFFIDQSTYIVGLDGKTIERIYGIYSKY